MRKNLLMISAAIAAVIINACKPEPVTPAPKPEPDPDPVPEQEHKHKFAKVNGQAATVAAPGWKDYYKCTDTYEPCGLFWEDSKGNTLIGDSQALEAWKSEGGRGYIPKLDPPHEGAGANCYIVAPGASVTFPALRGVSDDILEGIASTEVLWETFNTDVTPNTGDVVASASVSPDAKSITVTAGSKDGNAVVAAKASDGTILWSWHIWVSNYNPDSKPYLFNAGTLMDRNLGALSNTPEDVLSFGLLYQWGRKDPFPGSSILTDNTSDKRAATTGTWPSPVQSSSSKGTIDYAVAHPTTFITANMQNFDWNYTGSDRNDLTRWTYAKDPKGVYDPCPKGWRIPDGGLGGFWCTVFGATEIGQEVHEPAGGGWWRYKAGWFLAVEGADNGGYWFPCPGQIQAANKAMKEVGEQGFYANSASGNFINSMNIICIKIESWLGDLGPCILPIENQWVGYADGQSVRCVKQ